MKPDVKSGDFKKKNSDHKPPENTHPEQTQ